MMTRRLTSIIILFALLSHATLMQCPCSHASFPSLGTSIYVYVENEKWVNYTLLPATITINGSVQMDSTDPTAEAHVNLSATGPFECLVEPNEVVVKAGEVKNFVIYSNITLSVAPGDYRIDVHAYAVVYHAGVPTSEATSGGVIFIHIYNSTVNNTTTANMPCGEDKSISCIYMGVVVLSLSILALIALIIIRKRPNKK